MASTMTPGARRRFGDTVVQRLAALGPKGAVKQRRVFERVHAALARADDRVHAAEDALFAVLDEAGPLDVEQDRLVRELEEHLIAEGFPRVNPFIHLGFKPPAEIVRMPDEAEARLVMRLAAETLATRTSGPPAKATARALGRAAAAVLAGLEKKHRAEEALRRAVRARDEVFHAWDAALAGLRTALRAAHVKGGTRMYREVFGEAVAGRGKR